MTQSLTDFLETTLAKDMAKGPIALIYVEDDIGIGSSIRHHHRIGFDNLIVMTNADQTIPEDCLDICHHVINSDQDPLQIDAALNILISACPGRWLYYCYNSEYLHFPFCESRQIDELLTFIEEERRATAFTYVIDLYTNSLDQHPYGYSLETAHLDSSGYYALRRERDGQVLDRQLSIFGGLKWRFEEHLPQTKRRIDRTALFKAKPGLTISTDLLFNDDEYNTYQCPWHHSATVAVCSFRTAKYLKSNPGSTFEITSFNWSQSEKFHWNSQQLMDLGLMEPGQWF